MHYSTLFTLSSNRTTITSTINTIQLMLKNPKESTKMYSYTSIQCSAPNKSLTKPILTAATPSTLQPTQLCFPSPSRSHQRSSDGEQHHERRRRHVAVSARSPGRAGKHRRPRLPLADRRRRCRLHHRRCRRFSLWRCRCRSTGRRCVSNGTRSWDLSRRLCIEIARSNMQIISITS